MGGVSVHGLWKGNPLYNHLRVEFRFHEDLDAQVGLTATKNRVSLSQQISDKIKGDVKNFRNGYKYEKKMSTADQKELQDDLDKYTERLKKNGAALGAAKSKKETEDTKKSAPKNNSGSVLPKNTGITRKPPQAPIRIVPKFEITSFPSDEAISYSIENNNIIVFINQESLFIKENYIGASTESQKLLRIHWSAVALTLYKEYDEDEREFSLCKAYTEKVTKMMTEIHKFVN